MPAPDVVALGIDGIGVLAMAASLAGIFSLEPIFKLVGVKPGLALTIFSQPCEVPQYCLAMEDKLSPSATTWIIAGAADGGADFAEDFVAAPLTADALGATLGATLGVTLGATLGVDDVVCVALGAFAPALVLVGTGAMVAALGAVALEVCAVALEVCEVVLEVCEVVLEVGALALTPTTAPEVVTGVKPGKLLGNGCMGELSGAKPGGMEGLLDCVVEPIALVGAVVGVVVGSDDDETETGAEGDDELEERTSSIGLPSSVATLAPNCLRTSNFSVMGLLTVGANQA